MFAYWPICNRGRMNCGETLIVFIIPDPCLWHRNDFPSPAEEKTPWAGKPTLYRQLGLGFYGGVGVLRHAGVDAGILLREVGNLEAATSHHFHTALAGTERRMLGK